MSTLILGLNVAAAILMAFFAVVNMAKGNYIIAIIDIALMLLNIYVVLLRINIRR